MRILAFDTATAATTVASLDTRAGFELEARDDPVAGGRPGHAQKLLSLIEEVLAASDGGWSQIERIAVGTGPGTFTGMRIGIASAQALARSTGAQLVGVSTLASLEHQARAALGEDTPVLAVIDARRGEAFVSGMGLEPRVLTPAALVQATERLAAQAARPGLGDNLTAIGDGAVKFRALLTGAGANVPGDQSSLHRVSAIYHCRLAVQARPEGSSVVAATYLRLPDAELAARS